MGLVLVITLVPVLSVNRLQGVLECEATNLLALFKTQSNRRAEVEADPDARQAALFRRLRETVIRAHCACRRGTGDAEIEMIAVEEGGQHLRRRGTVDCMVRGIVGKPWSHNQRRPGRVRDGVRVAVSVGGSDCRNWSPKVVSVFGIERPR